MIEQSTYFPTSMISSAYYHTERKEAQSYNGCANPHMPSTVSKLISKQFMRAKHLFGALDLEAARKGQDLLGELGAKALRDHVVYSKEPFPQFEADWALPLEGPDSGVILYLHGGAYTAGTLAYARGFGGILAHRTRRITLCVGYRLAPEHPFPAALDDALAAYQRILETYPTQPIAIVGESAGGGLSFALALRIRERGLRAPVCIVALSPWTDLTCSNSSYQTNADVDPCLFEASLKQSAAFYAGDDLRNPLVSPVFGDVTGLAPTLIYAGSIELLLDDSVEMALRLDEAGGFSELHIVDDMWHAFVLYGTPEAKDALDRIEEFIGEHTADKRY